jgi:hypothetical protein
MEKLKFDSALISTGSNRGLPLTDKAATLMVGKVKNIQTTSRGSKWGYVDMKFKGDDYEITTMTYMEFMVKKSSKSDEWVKIGPALKAKFPDRDHLIIPSELSITVEKRMNGEERATVTTSRGTTIELSDHKIHNYTLSALSKLQDGEDEEED